MAEHFETRPELASAGQFDGQGDHQHIGVEPEAPRITQLRGPLLWDGCGAQETGEGVVAEPDWDLANQSPPDYPDDQRTDW